MTCNDYLSFQKTPLFNLKTQDSEHYLNPFGQLLFTQSWKWSQLHQPHPKPKTTQQPTTPSLKKDVLIWFENLNDKDKIAVTAISNPAFSQPFLHMLTHRQHHRLFNLTSQRWVDGIDVGQEDAFFELLLEELRIGYLSEPVLYFKNAQIMDIRMLNWLNTVSNSRVFQYAAKGRKGEENPLWFSSVSYRYLEDWLASQLQIVIVKHFLNKAVPQFLLPTLQGHLKNMGKHNQLAGLSLSLFDAQKKSKCEISILKTKVKEEQEKFIDYRQQKLLKSMEVSEQMKKKNKRKTKKKNNKIDDTQKQNRRQEEKVEQSPEKQDSPMKQEQQMDQIKIQQMPSLQQSKVLQDQKQCIKQVRQQQNIDILLQPEPKIQQKSIKNNEDRSVTPRNRKNSIPRNLIRISPKRTRSPQQLRSKGMLEQQQIKQKYSEQDKASSPITEDQKSSEPTFSIQQSYIQQKACGKRRRKRGKKQNQKLHEVKQILYSRLTSRQIENLVDQLGIQTNSLYNHKIISFQRVRVFVQSLYPLANAILFGSNAIGLSLPNSDVDILLTGLQCASRQEASQILAQIAVEINAMGWVVSCSTYLWAKVPIVKLQIDTSISFLQTKRRQDLYRVYNPALLYHLDHVNEVAGGTIKVDITINIEGITSVGYQSTILMRDWISKIPILQKLVLIFKYILSVQGYNSNFAGGIGSYCLFVMIAAFLKQNGRQSEVDLCKDFQNILKWYGEDFDNISSVVWLRQEGTCFVNQHLLKHEIDQSKRGLLKLIDPITEKTMNSSCNEYNNIKTEFRRILYDVKIWERLIQDQLRVGGVTTPELLRIIQSKKSIDKWLNKFEQKHTPSLRVIIERNNN